MIDGFLKKDTFGPDDDDDDVTRLNPLRSNINVIHAMYYQYRIT